VIAIDLSNTEPLEEQIYRELRRVIAGGDLAPGDRLPSARQLGGYLGVHWNTAARAYRRLHHDGLVTVGQGRHVVVRNGATDGERARARVVSLFREAVTEARLAGLSRDELGRALEAEMNTWNWKAEQ
jgi:GntR family transcriptional regulator